MTKLIIDVEQMVLGQVEVDLTLEQYVEYISKQNNAIMVSEFVAKVFNSQEEINLLNKKDPSYNYGQAEVIGAPSAEELQEYYNKINPPEPEPEDTTNESIEEEEKLEDGDAEDQ